MTARRTSPKKKAARKSSPKKRASRQRVAPARRGDPGARRRLLYIVVLGASVLAGLWASAWVLALDRRVVERFEGRRFSVPSRVLSAPAFLYSGLDWRRSDLAGMLLRRGYRTIPWPDSPRQDRLEPGTFSWGPDRVRVHLRGFEHPTRPEPDRDVALVLDGDVIAEIREVPGGREAGAILLEPQQVGAYFGMEREQRDLVRFDEVPRALIDAIVAVEDRRFASHHGVDPARIAGALVANVRAGGIRQGGSTLTQQLVKNFFLTPEKTFERKIQEAVMALLVEARYDKEAIFESYLNEIYLGQRGSTAVHGIGEASHFLFGKSAAQLTTAECALLAAIIQSPNRLAPHRNPDSAIERRNLVLDLMFEQGRLDLDAYELARDEPLRLAAMTGGHDESRYFLDYLRRQLPDVYDEEALTAEGLEIYSTLDPRLQRAAVKALTEGLEAVESEVQSERDEPLQGCLLVMRPQTGEILALVGGRDYGLSQFDRCTQARRQVGSVFKPVVYIAGLEPVAEAPTITLASFLDDTPLAIETPSGLWQPENYDHEFRERVTVREAVEKSLNVPTARLGVAVGIDRIVDVARRLGIESELPRVPSLALGTAELSPLEVARAYATLANGGARPVPHTFEDVVAAGETLDRRTLQLERVLDPGVAFLATSLLEGVVDRGTARGLRVMGIEGPLAGKTGTTDDEFDLWFVGFTPEIVVVVWLGFDEPREIGVPSSRGALPIFGNFVLEALGPRVRGRFFAPPGVERVEVEPSTGALALVGCPERRPELFLAGTEPRGLCPEGGSLTGDPAVSENGGRSKNRRRGGGLGGWLRRLF